MGISIFNISGFFLRFQQKMGGFRQNKTRPFKKTIILQSEIDRFFVCPQKRLSYS